jgi:DNA polymerase I
MKLQILDVDYTLLNGLPLLRLFGKTPTGETVCVFWDKFRPYFYVNAKPEQYPSILAELKKQWPELEGQVIEKFLPGGYSTAQTKVLKVIGKDPSRVPEQRELVQRMGAIPYEADVLFKYRWMVDTKLKGMSWIEVEGNQVRTDTVKCKAIQATSIKSVEAMENAPFRYLALDIETVAAGEGLPVPSKDPVVMISLAFSPAWRGKTSLVLVSRPTAGEGVEGCPDEKNMLRRLGEVIQDYDPDALDGYNIEGFDLPYLLERLDKLQLPRDLGRTNKPVFIKAFGKDKIASVTGRLVIDPFAILKRDPWLKFKRYDLRTVAKALLNADKLEMGGVPEISRLWKSGKREDLQRLVEYNKRDSELALRLVLEKGLLDKFIEIAKISGLLLQDTFGGQSQRLECVLLHEFRDRGFIVPCKPAGFELQKRRDERETLGLKGALVLEPIVGLHTGGCTLVLDFASLYPSIIRTFNICPTTLVRDFGAGQLSDSDVNKAPNGAVFVKPAIREGVLPKIVRELVENRAAVKRAAKSEADPERKRVLNAKQLALKDMANSMYGYTGYIRSRLYVMDIANAITAYGRENIQLTQKLIEQGFPAVKVLYGDTDSVFIKTDTADLDRATRLGEEVSAYVTARLPGLKFSFEKVYRSFLILTKKRYAGWAFEKAADGSWKDRLEMKGIETVRRDWCDLTTQTMREVLEIVLKEQDIKAATVHVRGVVKDLQGGKVPLEKLTVVKGVTRSIESYAGIQPHVELAKRIKLRDPTRGSLVGERLGYVIVRGNAMLSKRAEEPQYVKENGMEIDSQYYVESQLLPPVERIFEALGISRIELLEGSRQMKLNLAGLAAGNGNAKVSSPETTILTGWEAIACGKCSWSFYRPPLAGVCPRCGHQLYFQQGGNLGKFVRPQLK